MIRKKGCKNDLIKKLNYGGKKKMLKKILIIFLLLCIMLISVPLLTTHTEAARANTKLRLHGKLVTWIGLMGCDCTRRAYDCYCVLEL